MLIYFQVILSFFLTFIKKEKIMNKTILQLSFYIDKITKKEVCGILFLKQNSRKDSQFTCVFGPREI